MPEVGRLQRDIIPKYLEIKFFIVGNKFLQIQTCRKAFCQFFILRKYFIYGIDLFCNIADSYKDNSHDHEILQCIRIEFFIAQIKIFIKNHIQFIIHIDQGFGFCTALQCNTYIAKFFRQF